MIHVNPSSRGAGKGADAPPTSPSPERLIPEAGPGSLTPRFSLTPALSHASARTSSERSSTTHTPPFGFAHTRRHSTAERPTHSLGATLAEPLAPPAPLDRSLDLQEAILDHLPLVPYPESRSSLSAKGGSRPPFHVADDTPVLRALAPSGTRQVAIASARPLALLPAPASPARPLRRLPAAAPSCPPAGRRGLIACALPACGDRVGLVLTAGRSGAFGGWAGADRPGGAKGRTRNDYT